MEEKIIVNIEDIEDIKINENGEVIAKLKQKDNGTTKVNIFNHLCTKENNILNVYVFVKMENDNTSMYYIVLCSLKINKEKIIGNVDYFDSNKNYDLLKDTFERKIDSLLEKENLFCVDDDDNKILYSVLENVKEYIENNLSQRFENFEN